MPTLSPLVRSLIAATAGALAYGGWAYYINRPAGADMGMIAALVQGSFSFVLTLTLTLVIEYLQKLFRPGKLGTTMTILCSSAFMLAAAYAAQWSAGTPEILMTILPGYVIGSVYAATYALSLHAQDTRLPVRE